MKGWAGVARLGGIGDDLMAASVCRPLKRQGYMVDVITAEPNHVVYLHNPYIDKLSIKKPGDLPEGDMNAWQKWFASRAREYDVFAHLSHSCEGKHAYFTGMTEFWRPEEYRRRVAGGNYLETCHDIAGVPYDFGPLYFVSDDEKAKALDTKAKVGPRCIGWVLSGSRVDKVYPGATLAISRIISELNIPVVMVGAGGPEFAMAEQIMHTVEEHNGTHAGLHLALTPDGTPPGEDRSWHLRRSLAMLQACDLIVTPDTGAAWAVAFEEMPKVCMISHASAENITKHWVRTITLQADNDRVPCFPCHRLHDTIDTCVPNAQNNGAKCISDISVECVLTAVRAGLGESGALQRLHEKFGSNVVLRGQWNGT